VNTANMTYTDQLRYKFGHLDPKMQRGLIGFGYGGMFGSTLGLLNGMQHLGDEDLRAGRRIVKMARSGLAGGCFCGILVTVGFTMLR